jgi:GNAT superfamily N-acetyltransferase
MDTEAAMYDRGMRTLVASWSEFARWSSNAVVQCFSGVTVAVFPMPPERGFYINAVLDRGLTTVGYVDAVDATEATYAAARIVAAAMAFDCDDDCGVYNVGTVEAYRRRGYGTALTVAHLYDALGRGCRTASLQSTAMAESLYAAVGFEDLGQIVEYVPAITA